jgi:hypothetical protein
MWTKRQLVYQAYEEVGLASYVYDIQPEQEMSALRRLDAMMAEWDAKGIRLGYPVASDANGSDLDQSSGIPDWANSAVYKNLALEISGTVGKQPTMQLVKSAQMGYDTLFYRSSVPKERRLDRIPAGAGNKTINHTIYIRPDSDDPLRSSGDGTLEL